jgi:minor histocompatibility antigen H13
VASVLRPLQPKTQCIPQRKPLDESRKSLLEQQDDDEDEEIPDRLSSGDAWLFPVVRSIPMNPHEIAEVFLQFGSVALFGLYMVVKYFGKEWINYLLGWYFSVAGVWSVWKSLISLARFAVGPDRWIQFDKTKVLVLKGPRGMSPFEIFWNCR